MSCRTPFLFCSCVTFFLQLTLQAPAFAAGLRGTVTDPDGRPVPVARIIIMGSRPDTVELDTAADGMYEAMHIPDGAYVARVVLDGFVTEAARMQVSDATPVEVPFRVGEALIRRPRHQGLVSATFTERRLTAYVDAVFRGEVRDIEHTFGAFGGVFMAKGYRAANGGATVRVARTVDAFVPVENIGGRRFEEAFGFPSPGRTATVGVRVATGR
jgi:hypothetical protein